MKKRVIIGLSVFLVLSFIAGIAVAGNKIYLIMNGKEITNASPVIIQGKTYVPLRVIAETLGADVEWNGDSRTVFVDGGNSSLGNQAISDLETMEGLQQITMAYHLEVDYLRKVHINLSMLTIPQDSKTAITFINRASEGLKQAEVYENAMRELINSLNIEPEIANDLRNGLNEISDFRQEYISIANEYGNTGDAVKFTGDLLSAGNSLEQHIEDSIDSMTGVSDDLYKYIQGLKK